MNAMSTPAWQRQPSLCCLCRRSRKVVVKATILKSFYNPSMPLAPEMSFNLGRKTHKEYLEMKRESVLKKD